MPLSSVLGAQSITKPGVCTSATRPSSPFDGQVIYETDTDRTLVWNNSVWVAVSYAVYSSSTRPASPYEGQLIYETDTDRVAAYNGSAWVYTAASGMVRVLSQSFTSSTTVNVNNCFSSSYINYTVKLNSTGSNGAVTGLRLRASGTDNTTASSYSRQRLYLNNATFTASSTSGDSNQACLMEAGSNIGSVIEFWSPFVADRTSISTISGINGGEALWTYGRHDVQASYDGFSILFTNANTGTLDVYGWSR